MTGRNYCILIKPDKVNSCMKDKELTDYKFFCFNGTPKFLYISRGLENHATASISFVTLDWKFAPFKRSDFMGFEELPEKPQHLEEMVALAKKLSESFPFLRVDLYEAKGRVYFSELTFSPCGAYLPFQPKEWDKKLGALLTLPLRFNIVRG